ncbi:MAG: PhnD/SsuA/transferrin family substrate-binding protein [Nitrospinae bacterium]|nr:PhnD/SsuA/transferrin family substrate-binding protein [Nitrospinota bacterium]
MGKNWIFLFFLFVTTMCLFTVITLSCPDIVSADKKTTIFFYNPEANINNFVSLKAEFDAYLFPLGNFQFQPVSSEQVFEGVIKESLSASEGDIFILSSWHFNVIKKRLSLEPSLIATIKGRATYEKILITKKDISEIKQLKGAAVASAGSEEYTIHLLKGLLGKGNEHIASSMRILKVPKDIDALMSVGFGMAQAAIASEFSLEKMSHLNSSQYNMFKQLVKTGDLLLPVVVVPKKQSPLRDRVIEILTGMGNADEGRSRLKMLGFDGWKPVEKAERRVLENEGN